LTFCIPASLLEEAKERSNKEKFLLIITQVKEVGVIRDSSLGPKLLPPSPDSVRLFLHVFLVGAKDDSAITNIDWMHCCSAVAHKMDEEPVLGHVYASCGVLCTQELGKASSAAD
jgi:hypothetical protein